MLNDVDRRDTSENKNGNESNLRHELEEQERPQRDNHRHGIKTKINVMTENKTEKEVSLEEIKRKRDIIRRPLKKIDVVYKSGDKADIFREEENNLKE